MAQYIEKAALVAEINKRIIDAPVNNIGHQRVWAYNDVKDILDTLEVKEVDLDAELEHYKADQNIKYEEDINIFEFAKHFFELGMSVSNKAQKGK